MELEDPGDSWEQYRALLDRTRRLYRLAARRLARRTAKRGDEIGETVERFDDLHRGLVVRVYVGVCGADDVWSAEEVELGAVLMDHAWSQRLEGAELRQALRHADDNARSLEWTTLVGPFARHEFLRDSVADLETLVVRQANLIARVEQIQLAPNLPWSVSKDGFIEQGGGAVPLAIVEPESLDELTKVGANLFRPRGEVLPVAPAAREVQSGYLEMSAANSTRQMMAMIEASRAFEANARMIQTQDERHGPTRWPAPADRVGLL